MEKNQTTTTPQPKRRRKSGSPLPYFLVFCVVVAALFFYFRYQEQVARLVSGDTEPEISTPAPSPGPVQPDQQATQSPPLSSDSVSPDNPGDTKPLDESLVTSDLPVLTPSTDDSANLSADQLYQNAQANIEQFYAHLDQQDYMKPFNLDTPSDIYFSTLIQKVIDNPPLVSGETDDLFNVLKNTAHFFRIVGKKNIIILKAILDREKDSFEQVLADYYTLANSQHLVSGNPEFTINQDSLYDYAGFFLNTMGGRLYLFRRDSHSRMVVSYYSILILDKANRDGRNRHGIDIKPAVDVLIDELETGGARLKMADSYLDKLYELKEKYM